ncbi:putative uncharacterized protein [Streptomyces azureus]|uniref:Uncharacterized protein n=1 Tax=Streptomyces azureus TaxID=146537 RepID=A0A0K8PN92_STRAJ|nr:putative uncharacterized protein [Streptomyces azureus]
MPCAPQRPPEPEEQQNLPEQHRSREHGKGQHGDDRRTVEQTDDEVKHGTSQNRPAAPGT